jgi:hypothetical protein
MIADRRVEPQTPDDEAAVAAAEAAVDELEAVGTDS